MMNPWIWLTVTYAFSYVFGLLFGHVRGAQNIAHVAGSFLPITVFAVIIGIWRAPKWQDAKLKEQRMAEEGEYGG
jgi:hypothetical protein